MERKTTAPFAKHWHSSSIHLLILSFLNDRRGCVQLLKVFSSSRQFTHGLPQGSALAPLLFLFNIKDLDSTLNDDAVIALFADDVSILTTARKRKDAEAAAQLVVNSVATWTGMEIKLER